MAAATLDTTRQIARHKEMARYALEQVCSGKRLDEAAACYHAEFADHVNATDFHGMEGIRGSVSGYLEALGDFSITVEDQIAEGDRVANRWTLRGMSQSRPVTVSGVTISRFEDDRIREDWSYYDSAEVARQLGGASLLAGADLYWVSKQLGHANIATTLKHYARFLPAVDERNLKLLDEFAA